MPLGLICEGGLCEAVALDLKFGGSPGMREVLFFSFLFFLIERRRQAEGEREF